MSTKLNEEYLPALQCASCKKLQDIATGSSSCHRLHQFSQYISRLSLFTFF